MMNPAANKINRSLVAILRSSATERVPIGASWCGPPITASRLARYARGSVVARLHWLASASVLDSLLANIDADLFFF